MKKSYRQTSTLQDVGAFSPFNIKLFRNPFFRMTSWAATQKEHVGTALILIFGLLLAGCSATGPTFTEAPHPDLGRTSVYVYRLAGGPGTRVPQSVYLDGEKVASIYEEGFTWFYVPDGRHDVAAGFKFMMRPIPETLSVYYFRYWQVPFTDAKGPGATVDFERVPTDVALKEMANFRYSPAKLE